MAIPVLNGGLRLLRAVDAALGQAEGVEVLIADSGSTDGADRAAARRPSVRILDVIGGFDHGAVRTALVLQARTDRVALLTQDALPLPGCLAALADAAGEGISGAWARQIPGPDGPAAVRRTLERWSPPGRTPVVQRLGSERWSELSPRQRMALARFDNVASLVRREAIERLPFPSRSFGEDIAWGAAVIQAGGALAYAPAARVEHHHPPSIREAWSRNLAAHEQAAREFGLVAVPSLPAGARAWVSEAGSAIAHDGVLAGVASMPRHGAALLGQWRGARRVSP